jgi:hypothetical protein
LVYCCNCNSDTTPGIYYLCNGGNEGLCGYTRENRQNNRKILIKEVVENAMKTEKCTLLCKKGEMNAMFLFPCGCVVCGIGCWGEHIANAFAGDTASNLRISKGDDYGSLWCDLHCVEYTRYFLSFSCEYFSFLFCSCF